MRYTIRGWKEIARYLGVDPRTAMRYEENAGLPVHRLGNGPKARAYAFKDGLDEWMNAHEESALPTGQGIADRMLARIAELSSGMLYRRHFQMRFHLRVRGSGVQATIETEYELINSSAEPRPYTQEITIDDCEAGFVDSMSVFADGEPIYTLMRPEMTKKLRGYAAYQGQVRLIEPAASGHTYRGLANWIVTRRDNDFWYLHMGIPTLGVEAEISAPPEFDITPSFSTTHLYLVGEHVDVTWERQRKR